MNWLTKAWNKVNDAADWVLDKAKDGIQWMGEKVGLMDEDGTFNDELEEPVNQTMDTLVDYLPTPSWTKEQTKNLINAENKELIGIKPMQIPSAENGYSIVDTTGMNEETNINNFQDTIALMENYRNEQWAREDQIRKETQEREDSAYQRAVEDMQKAGINPNLVGANAAASGGGITQATGINLSPYETEFKAEMDKLLQLIDEGFKEDENAKDRFNDIFSKVLQLFVAKTMFK